MFEEFFFFYVGLDWWQDVCDDDVILVQYGLVWLEDIGLVDDGNDWYVEVVIEVGDVEFVDGFCVGWMVCFFWVDDELMFSFYFFECLGYDFCYGFVVS